MKMKRFRTRKALLALLPLLALVAFLAAGCGGHASTTSALCAVVIGDGQSSHDSNVHNTYFPNQKIHYANQSELVRYFPCNSRNYIVNPGKTLNAANQVIGDRHSPTTAKTKGHTLVQIWSHALWTLNEDKTIIKNRFWPVCLKYTCYQTNSGGSSSNFSTPGWNGMLGEVLGPALDRSIAAVINNANDSVWVDSDQTEFTKLGAKASNLFAAKVQQELGYQDPVFCGSGNSQWPNPLNPGKGTFHCSNVRIVIDAIEPVSKQLAAQVQSVSLNQQRLEKAKDLYGSMASYFLGLQDTVEACKTAAVACVINIGGSPAAIPVVTGKK
jgi:hypothetical protein